MLNRLRRRYARRLSLRRAAAGQAASPGAASAADTQAFLQVARQSFLQMQAAWDRADLPAMGVLASESLLEDLREQLAQRGQAGNHTEVLELHARLVAIEDLHEALLASVEFSGLIREQLDDTAAPFRELWMLAKIKSADAGWRLARVQSLG